MVDFGHSVLDLEPDVAEDSACIVFWFILQKIVLLFLPLLFPEDFLRSFARLFQNSCWEG